MTPSLSYSNAASHFALRARNPTFLCTSKDLQSNTQTSVQGLITSQRDVSVYMYPSIHVFLHYNKTDHLRHVFFKFIFAFFATMKSKYRKPFNIAGFYQSQATYCVAIPLSRDFIFLPIAVFELR